MFPLFSTLYPTNNIRGHLRQHYYIIFEVPDPVPTPDAHANVQISIEVNATAPAANNVKIFQVIDARSTIVMDDDRLVITKPDRSVRLQGQLKRL